MWAIFKEEEKKQWEKKVPLVHNIETLERFIGVGDGKQLPPAVLSHKKKREDETMINEFAEALVIPLVVRAQWSGLDTSMFMYWCINLALLLVDSLAPRVAFTQIICRGRSPNMITVFALYQVMRTDLQGGLFSIHHRVHQLLFNNH